MTYIGESKTVEARSYPGYLTIVNAVDEHRRPKGGSVHTTGMHLHWQAGPVNADNGRNGAFIEDPITAAIERLRSVLAEKIEVRPKGQLAVLNVGEARQAARKRGNHTLRVIHRPEPERESHAGIEGYGDSHAQRLRIAGALRDLVRRCCMHDAVA